MDAQALHDYFDLLQDTQGAPFFEEDEKDSFLTQATLAFVKEQLPPGEDHFELNEINFQNIYTIVYNTGTATMSSGGLITLAAIQALLNTASSSTEPLMSILGVNWTKSSVTYPVKYTKHNNWFAYERNIFKAGSSTVPRYKYDKTNMTFSPIDTTATVNFTLLKQPKAVSLAGAVTIELPAHTHKTIVEMAVNLASIATRDAELLQLNNAK